MGEIAWKKLGPMDLEVNDVLKLSISKEESEDDPPTALAHTGHEFGRHGGVNILIEASITVTAMEAETMRCTFVGELGHKRDFFIYCTTSCNFFLFLLIRDKNIN